MTVRVAIQELRHYRHRNSFIALAVVITTVLIFIIPSLGMSMIDGQRTVINELYPSWHGSIAPVDEETVTKIQVHHDVDKVGVRSQVGTIQMEGLQCQLLYMDGEGYDLYNQHLLAGKWPTKSNDIVVSRQFIEIQGLNLTIGDFIELPVQVIDDGQLGYAMKERFVISGFVDREKGTEDEVTSIAFISKAYLDKMIPAERQDYSAVFQTKQDTDATMDEIEDTVNTLGRQLQIPQKNISVNKTYILANYVDPSIIPSIAIIVGVVIIIGMMTTYSIYYVGMDERVRDYGKIKAIGATSKQLRQIVFIEGSVVGLLGLIIGLVLATILLKGVFQGFLLLYNDQNIVVTEMHRLYYSGEIQLYHGYIYMITIGLTSIFVYLSLLKPMRILSKVSEIEAIKFNGSIDRWDGSKVQGKCLHNGRCHAKKRRNKISVVTLALTHIMSHKKKTIVTIVSMSGTGILMMVVATILSCANPYNSANEEILGQFSLTISIDNNNKEHPERMWAEIIRNNPLDDVLIHQLEKLEGVEDVVPFQSLEVTSPIFGEEVESIVGIPELYKNELLDGIVEGDVTWEALERGKEVIVDKRLLQWYPDIHVGDVLHLTMETNTPVNDVSLVVAAIGNYSTALSHYHYMLMGSKGIESLTDRNTTEAIHLFVEQRMEDDVEEYLLHVVEQQENSIVLDSWQDIYSEWEKALTLVTGISYAFLFILFMISITNLVNTRVHYVHVRKKEIGIIQALGMTDKQLFKQLQIEGGLYTLGTLVIALSIGSGLGYPIFLWARDNGILSITQYHYPFVPAIIMSGGLIIVQGALTAVLSRSAKKESVIERIRYGE